MAIYVSPAQLQYEEMLRNKRFQEHHYRQSFDDPEALGRMPRSRSFGAVPQYAPFANGFQQQPAMLPQINQPMAPQINQPNNREDTDWLEQFPGQREKPAEKSIAPKSFFAQDTAPSAWHTNHVIPGGRQSAHNQHQDYRLALKHHREATFKNAMAKYIQDDNLSQNKRETDKERFQRQMEEGRYDPFGKGGGGAPMTGPQGTYTRNRGFLDRSLSQGSLNYAGIDERNNNSAPSRYQPQQNQQVSNGFAHPVQPVYAAPQQFYTGYPPPVAGYEMQGYPQMYTQAIAPRSEVQQGQHVVHAQAYQPTILSPKPRAPDPQPLQTHPGPPPLPYHNPQPLQTNANPTTLPYNNPQQLQTHANPPTHPYNPAQASGPPSPRRVPPQDPSMFHHPSAIPSAGAQRQPPTIGRPIFPAGRPRVGDQSGFGGGYDAIRKAADERYRQELREQIELKQRQKREEEERERLEEERERRYIEDVRRREAEEEENRKHRERDVLQERRQKEIRRNDMILQQGASTEVDHPPLNHPPMKQHSFAEEPRRRKPVDSDLEWWEKQPVRDTEKKKGSAKIVPNIMLEKPDPRQRRRQSREDVIQVTLNAKLPTDKSFDNAEKIDQNLHREKEKTPRAEHAPLREKPLNLSESLPRQVEALRFRQSEENLARDIPEDGLQSKLQQLHLRDQDRSSDSEADIYDVDDLAKTHTLPSRQNRPKQPEINRTQSLSRKRRPPAKAEKRPGTPPERIYETVNRPNKSMEVDPDLGDDIVEDYAEQLKKLRQKKNKRQAMNILLNSLFCVIAFVIFLIMICYFLPKKYQKEMAQKKLQRRQNNVQPEVHSC